MSLYSLAVRWRPEELRSLAFGSIGAGYTALGSPMENPVVNYCIDNNTDEAVIISQDGVTDHIFVGANSFKLYDVQSNHGKGDALMLSKGTQLYVKQESAAPTTGSVYVTVFYAANN